jgi:hypothetical protein
MPWLVFLRRRLPPPSPSMAAATLIIFLVIVFVSLDTKEKHKIEQTEGEEKMVSFTFDLKEHFT